MSSDSTPSSQFSESADQVSPLPKSNAASCRKRPRSSLESFEQMMCPVCTEYFVPPIVQCSKGHSICYRCVSNMVRVSGDDKCPLCRSYMMMGCRNYALEGQMSYITIGCVWEDRGCTKRVTLVERARHELYCEFRPSTINCYLNHARFNWECKWQGNPLLLPKHLVEDHKYPKIKREQVVKFVWNPPREDMFRSRFRVLKVKIPRHNKDTSSFVLEHVYLEDRKLNLFTVRSLEPDFEVPCSIRIIDREDSELRLALDFKTCDFEKMGPLVDYEHLDFRRCLVVPMEVLKKYSYIDLTENEEYFSFHVDFPSANKLTNA